MRLPSIFVGGIPSKLFSNVDYTGWRNAGSILPRSHFSEARQRRHYNEKQLALPVKAYAGFILKFGLP